MSFSAKIKITDVCLLVDDIDRTINFYVNTLGFKLRRRAEGFADFHSEHVTLAAWQRDHIHSHCGVSNMRGPPGISKACIAMRLENPADIDAMYEHLSAQGVKFVSVPRDYVWNARCAYFTDPDDTVWEIYAWREGGPKHDFDSANLNT